MSERRISKWELVEPAPAAIRAPAGGTEMPGVMSSRSHATATHTRDHTSVLAAVERHVLIWLAKRMPTYVTSDGLTCLGAVGMVGVGCALAAASLSRGWLALVPVFLAVNWFGDSLDGTLARVRHAQRPRYGYYLDHVVDLANTLVLFAGLAVSGIASPLVAAGLLVAYLLLAAESFLATHALGVFRISFAGFGPTELRILLSVGAIVAIGRPVVTPFGLGEVRLWDVGGLCGIAGMLTVFAINAVRNARALSAADPLPGGTP
jgi:phosphatidylglycerophosphate synthase